MQKGMIIALFFAVEMYSYRAYFFIYMQYFFNSRPQYRNASDAPVQL